MVTARTNRAGRQRHDGHVKRAKLTPGIWFLKSTTFRDIYGEDVEYHGTRPSLTAQEYMERSRAGWHKPRLANYRYENHFAGIDTFFAWGNPSPSAPFALIVIDVDVQKRYRKGSAEGAREFVEHLKKHFWPSMYWERSRGGQGINAYLVIRKPGQTAKQVNVDLGKFESWLRAESVGHDIEAVEVKGKLPELTYRHGEIWDVKFGSFGRLPRNADACRFTHKVNLHELGQLPVKAAVDVPAKVDHAGSGRMVTATDLAMLPYYEKLYPGRMKAKRWLVTEKDFGICLLLMRKFREKPNRDGTMPYRRVEAVWKELYDAGHVERPFNYQRWKKVRDWLSEQGHIDWIDERYQPGQSACKWQLGDKMYDVLTYIEWGGDFANTPLVARGDHGYKTPRLAILTGLVDDEKLRKQEKDVEMLFAA